MAFAVKVKGQDKNVVSTHLFFRLLTKFSIVISGIRMKSPSPTVVWSAITAAGIHYSVHKQAQVPNCHSRTALAKPKLPWERSHLDWSRGSFLGGWQRPSATIQPAPYTSLTGEPHRRFNRHDPALNIFIVMF